MTKRRLRLNDQYLNLFLTRSNSCLEFYYNGKIEPEEVSQPVTNNTPQQAETKIINNYFSIGVDSRIAMDFHEMRNNNPALFQSKFINYMWYGGIGMKNMFLHATNLCGVVELTIDGEKIPRISKKLETLVFFKYSINIWWYKSLGRK